MGLDRIAKDRESLGSRVVVERGEKALDDRELAGKVVCIGVERVDLCIGLDEVDVLQSFGVRLSSGLLEHRG